MMLPRLTLIALLLVSATRAVALDCYVKVQGVTGAIAPAIAGFEFGASTAVLIDGSGTIAGATQARELVINRSPDQSSPPLMSRLFAGQVIDEVVCLAQGSDGRVLVQATFQTVYVSDINLQASGGDDLPYERVTLVYGKLGLHVLEDDRSTYGSTGWNFMANRAEVVGTAPESPAQPKRSLRIFLVPADIGADVEATLIQSGVVPLSEFIGADGTVQFDNLDRTKTIDLEFLTVPMEGG